MKKRQLLGMHTQVLLTCILLFLSISNLLGCRKMTLVLYSKESKDKKSYSSTIHIELDEKVFQKARHHH